MVVVVVEVELVVVVVAEQFGSTMLLLMGATTQLSFVAQVAFVFMMRTICVEFFCLGSTLA